MKLYFLLFCLVVASISLSQSKKEQIEILTNRIDSLRNVITLERITTQNEKNTLIKSLDSLKEKKSSLDITLENCNNDLLVKQNQIENLIIEMNSVLDSLKEKSYTSIPEYLGINYENTKWIFLNGTESEQSSYYQKIFKLKCLKEMSVNPEIEKISVVKLSKYFDVIMWSDYAQERYSDIDFTLVDSLVNVYLVQNDFNIFLDNSNNFNFGSGYTNFPCSRIGDLLFCYYNEANCGWNGPIYLFDLNDNVEDVVQVCDTIQNINLYNSYFKRIAGENFRVKEVMKRINHVGGDVYLFEIPLEKEFDSNCCPSFHLKIKTKYSNHKFEIIDKIQWSTSDNPNNWMTLN